MKLYNIDTQLINQYRLVDSKVNFNKDHDNMSRPYVGIVIERNDRKYFAPLASPKLLPNGKVRRLNGTITSNMFDDQHNSLGYIKYNNMIPVSDSFINVIDFSIQDKDYQQLLFKQLSWINSRKELITNKANRVFEIYDNNERLKSVCTDFDKLDQLHDSLI